MKILYYAIIELEIPGGPTVHTLNVLKGLQKVGVETLLICPKPIGKIADAVPGKTSWISFWGFSPFRLFLFGGVSFFMMIKNILGFRPDYVYMREMEGSLAVSLAAMICGVPLIVDVNGPFFGDYVRMKEEAHLGFKGVTGFNRLFMLIWRKIWRRIQFLIAAGFTFNSEGWRDQLCREFGYSFAKTKIMTMYVDCDRFKPMSQSESRKKIGIASGKVLLGYVGSFQPTHDIPLFVECLKWLLDHGIDGELLLIGGGSEKKRYQTELANSPMVNRIHFLGWIEPSFIPIHMNACDVGLAMLKSIKNFAAEAPLKMKEFLACGVPIVLESSAELFQRYPKDGACFVESKDINSIGEAILKSLKMSRPEGMRTMVSFIKSEFSLEVCGKELTSFFQSIKGKN